jgi:rhamnose transport system permease protein
MKSIQSGAAVLRIVFGRWEVVLIILIIGAALWSSSISPFFSQQNYLDMLKPFVAIGLMTLGLTLVVIIGEIDISITSILALSAVIFATTWSSGAPLVLAALLGIATGAALGLVNGLLVGVFGLPALAVTLGTQIGYQGLAFVILTTEGVTGFPDVLTQIGFGFLPGTQVPIAVIILAVFVVLFAILLHATRFGRHLFIIGSSKQAARFSGIPLRRIQVVVFAISGAMAGIAGLIYAGFFNTVRADIGSADLLDVVTAVVLGGVSIFGGSGSVPGVMLSLVLIATVRKGMGLANISSPVQGIVIGVLLVIAILIGHFFKQNPRRRRDQAANEGQRAAPVKEVGVRQQ